MRIMGKRKWAVLLSTIVLVVAAGGFFAYHKAMRRASRVLKMMENPGDRGNFSEAIRQIRGLKSVQEKDGAFSVARNEDHVLFSGWAARKLEKRTIEMLAETDDRRVLNSLLGVVVASEGDPSSTGLDFQRYGNPEWNIIKRACERYNEQLGLYGTRYFVREREDGSYGMGLRSSTIH